MTDYYSLDDTMAGRVAQAGLAGAIIALPDYVHSRGLRLLITTSIGAGGGVLVALVNTFDEDPDNDPAVMFDQLRHSAGDIGTTSGPDSDTASEINIDSPAQTWAIVGVALLVIAALGRLDGMVQKRIVKALRARGCRRPNTLVGGISAAVIFAISEAAHRQRMEKAQ